MKRAVLTAMIVLVPTLAFAQVEARTIELSGGASFVFNKQTVSDPTDDTGAFDLDVTTTTTGLELAYYISRRIGIGPFVSNVTFKMEAPDGTVPFQVSGGAFGGLVKIRFSAGGRTDFSLIGGGGFNRTTIKGEGVGDVSNDGFFYMAGAAVNLWLNDFATLDFGARYQATTLSSDFGDMDVAGLFAGVGFSIYLGK